MGVGGIDFTVQDHYQLERRCASVLGEAETRSLLDDGFVVFPERLTAQALGDLQAAMSELAQRHLARTPEALPEFHLPDPHRADVRFCHSLLMDAPLVDSVRCLLGPEIVLRRSTALFGYPGAHEAATWHTDQRYLVYPRPPLFTEPRLLTVLVYLTDVDDEIGPLYLRPGSHRLWAEPESDDAELADQLVLRPRAGEIVFVDAATWHRGGRNRSPNRVRQVIALSFVPIFYRRPPSPSAPTSADFERLVADARARGDVALLELFDVED
jgi:phytanoyl-CoA dioxygenase PhyH